MESPMTAGRARLSMARPQRGRTQTRRRWGRGVPRELDRLLLGPRFLLFLLVVIVAAGGDILLRCDDHVENFALVALVVVRVGQEIHNVVGGVGTAFVFLSLLVVAAPSSVCAILGTLQE